MGQPQEDVGVLGIQVGSQAVAAQRPSTVQQFRAHIFESRAPAPTEGAQSSLGVVGTLNDLVQCVELEDGLHRAENLLHQ